MESIRSPDQVLILLMDSIRSPDKVLILLIKSRLTPDEYVDSIRTPSGVYQEFIETIYI